MAQVTPVQLRMDRRTILTNIAALFSGSAIAQGLTAVMLLLTARQLGPEQYGQYTSSLVLATFCSIIFSLGLDLWLLREGGRTPSKVGSLSGSVLSIKFSIGLIWVFLFAIMAPFIKSSSFPTNLVRLSALFIWVGNLFSSTLMAFRAILRNQISSFFEASSVIAQFLLSLLLIALGEKLAVRYMQMRLGIVLLSLLISLTLVWYSLRIRPNLYTVKRALIESPPYAASEFMGWLFMRADVLIVATMLNEYAVGIYSPAVGILNATFLIPNAIQVVVLPVLSHLFDQDIRKAWLTARRTMAVLLVIGVVLFLALFIGAKFLTLILGPSFTEVQALLQILSIIILLHSLTFGLTTILIAANQQAKRSIVQIGAVLSNIILNLLIVRRGGVYGVAWVYVITEVLLLIGYSWLVLRFRIGDSAKIPTTRNGASQ
jgi:O-antigen/teichoic acid export membrane protein